MNIFQNPLNKQIWVSNFVTIRQDLKIYIYESSDGDEGNDHENVKYDSALQQLPQQTLMQQ